MRVAAQVQAEMAVILGRVFGLGLGAQHHFVDEGLMRRAFDALEDRVEQAWPHCALLRQFDADRGEHLAQAFELLGRRLVMDTVEQGNMGALQGFGGAHIGEDHELLDQAMSLETRRHDDAVDACRRA